MRVNAYLSRRACAGDPRLERATRMDTTPDPKPDATESSATNAAPTIESGLLGSTLRSRRMQSLFFLLCALASSPTLGALAEALPGEATVLAKIERHRGVREGELCGPHPGSPEIVSIQPAGGGPAHRENTEDAAYFWSSSVVQRSLVLYRHKPGIGLHPFQTAKRAQCSLNSTGGSGAHEARAD